MKNKIIALILLVFMLSGVINVSAYDIRQWYDSEYDLSLTDLTKELNWESGNYTTVDGVQTNEVTVSAIRVANNFGDGQIYIECQPGYQVIFAECVNEGGSLKVSRKQDATFYIPHQKWVDFTYVNTYADREYTIAVKSVDGFEMSKDTPEKYVSVSKVDLRYHIPEYYKQHIIEKSQVINNYQDNKDAFSFIVMTDMHLQNNAKHSPAMIKYLENQCGIKAIIDLGEMAENSDDLNEAAYLFENKMPINTYDKKNFYKDDVINKMRYIVVDFKDNSGVDYSTENFTDNVYSVSDSLKVWLENDAFNLPDDSWNYAIFSHAPVYDATNSPWGTAPLWSGESVADVLGNAKGNFLGVISGQTHLDGMLRYNGFNIVVTASDSTVSNDKREVNTQSEQSFDVYTVDPVNKIVYITKIGAGKDRAFIY